jgi:hypothetical protein
MADTRNYGKFRPRFRTGFQASFAVNAQPLPQGRMTDPTRT